MRETPAKLRTIVEHLGLATVQTKPAPGKWSVREIVAILPIARSPGHGGCGSFMEPSTPSCSPSSKTPWARAYEGRQHTAEAALAAFTAIRTWNLILIDNLPEVNRQRTAHHPEIGKLTLWAVVQIIAGHDVHHLNALEKDLTSGSLQSRGCRS